MAHAKIPRLSDRDLAAKLQTIYEEINGRSEFEINFVIFGHSVPGGRISEGGNSAWRQLTTLEGSVIEQVSFQLVHGMSFFYFRGGAAEPRSAYFDEINFALQPSEPTHLKFAAAILELFRPFPITPTGNAEDQTLSAVRALQENTLERLERLHEDGVRRASDSLSALEEEYRKRKAAVEDELVSHKLLLELENADEKNRLTQLEDSLKTRSDQLDDRDNTHARRDNRTRMLDDVKNRIADFGVSPRTAAKRAPVKFGIFLLATILLFFTAFTALEIHSISNAPSAIDNAAKAISVGISASAVAADLQASSSRTAAHDGLVIGLWIRLAVFSLGVAATILYYIRWEHAWADHHARSEFALQQFHIDVNRANWVMESCLEWHKTTGTQIPKSLVAAFTRGLFTSGDSMPAPAMHPADELASALIGSSSKLRLKAGDSEIEFDKPGKIPKTVKPQNEPGAT